DEGHAEEPDHLVAMLEFCTLLCHLEQRALTHGGDPGAYRRAQRDFIARYLEPLLTAIRTRFAEARDQGLDPTLAALIEALESLVGPCPAPRDASSRPDVDSRPLWD